MRAFVVLSLAAATLVASFAPKPPSSKPSALAAKSERRRWWGRRASQEVRNDSKGGGLLFWRRRRRGSEDVPGVTVEVPLTLGEELQLMTLGYSRREAQAMPASAARAVLAQGATRARGGPLVTRKELLEDEPTDLELFEAAKKEVAAMNRFARNELLDDDDDDHHHPRMSAKELNATLARTWPDLPRFTQLLTQEAIFRLRILGPAFAEPLKEESRMRRNAYRWWLEFVDGVGLFPPDDANPFFEPTGAPPIEQADDAVERVYYDMKKRRDDLRLIRSQFADWERRAAIRELAPPTKRRLP